MKRVSAIFIIIIFIFLLAGCLNNGGTPEKNSIQINPNEETSNMEKVPVTLYFGYMDEFLLAGEPRVIKTPVNGRMESAVLRELIKGPSPDNQSLTSLLDPGVQVVSVSDSDDYLFVTLNAKFIERMTAQNVSGEAEKYQQLAAYSIVNTLIELGGYSRVQLLIDLDGSGRGERIKRAYAGFGEAGDSTLEPMGMYGDIVLNPKNTVAQFLKNYANKDWEKVYDFIAYRSPSGEEKPAKEDFLSAVVSFNSGLEEYNTLDYYMSPDGALATVMADFKIKTKDGEYISDKNMPLKLTRENNIWRIIYDSFSKVFKI